MLLPADLNGSETPFFGTAEAAMFSIETHITCGASNVCQFPVVERAHEISKQVFSGHEMENPESSARWAQDTMFVNGVMGGP